MDATNLPFLLELIGWVGAILFSICALPQAYQCWKQGHADGINRLFMWSWFGGEVCMILYTLLLPFYTGTSFSSMLPLLTNYTFNLSLLLVIIYYAYFPRRVTG